MNEWILTTFLKVSLEGVTDLTWLSAYENYVVACSWSLCLFYLFKQPCNHPASRVIDIVHVPKWKAAKREWVGNLTHEWSAYLGWRYIMFCCFNRRKYQKNLLKNMTQIYQRASEWVREKGFFFYFTVIGINHSAREHRAWGKHLKFAATDIKRFIFAQSSMYRLLIDDVLPILNE